MKEVTSAAWLVYPFLKYLLQTRDNMTITVHIAGDETVHLRGLESKGCFIITGLIWDMARIHTFIFVCLFVHALLDYFFFSYWNNLFLTFYHEFVLKADLLREIAFFTQ